METTKISSSATPNFKRENLDEALKTPLCSKICISIIRKNFKNVCVLFLIYIFSSFNYFQLMELVMKHLTSKHLYIQRIIIKLIPRMASFDTEYFKKNFFSNIFEYLLLCVKTVRFFLIESLNHHFITSSGSC